MSNKSAMAKLANRKRQTQFCLKRRSEGQCRISAWVPKDLREEARAIILELLKIKRSDPSVTVELRAAESFRVSENVDPPTESAPEIRRSGSSEVKGEPSEIETKTAPSCPAIERAEASIQVELDLPGFESL